MKPKWKRGFDLLCGNGDGQLTFDDLLSIPSRLIKGVKLLLKKAFASIRTHSMAALSELFTAFLDAFSADDTKYKSAQSILQDVTETADETTRT